MTFIARFETETKGLDALSTGNYPREACETCKGEDADGETCDSCNGRGTTCACTSCEDAGEDEGSFSWRACETCGSSLGGDRYAAHALIMGADKALVHLDVCTDCLFFIANGDTPTDADDDDADDD